jgi:hypothetical protein
MQLELGHLITIGCFLFVQNLALCVFLWKAGGFVARVETAVQKVSEVGLQTQTEVRDTRAELRAHTQQEEHQFRDMLVHQTVFDGRLKAIEGRT